MATTYTLINSTTVGSGGASSVTFSSIPATYTDLVVKWSVRSTFGSAESAALYMLLNASSSNFTFKRLRGNGSTADSYGESSSTLYGTTDAGTATSNTFSNGELYIPNYTSSNYKSYSVDSVTENNASTAIAVFFAGLWSNTSAITSIGFSTDNNLGQYSTFYLYGINNS
jgi:TRAP-type mannitol/chloroaromatic compound transport system substrate-binding protein